MATGLSEFPSSPGHIDAELKLTPLAGLLLDLLHGDLQKEVQRILRHGNDGQYDEENNVNPLGHRRGRPEHGVCDRLKEIIRLIGLSMGISC